MDNAVSHKARLSGRPPKFKEPSRPVTVTLPERTLDQLSRFNADRAIAIVEAVDAATAGATTEFSAPDVVPVTPEMGIVVVPSNRSLRMLPWLRLIEVAPARHLIAIEPGTPIEKIEVAIIDLIEVARFEAPEEVPMLETLREKVGYLRRRGRFSKAEMIFVATDRMS